MTNPILRIVKICVIATWSKETGCFNSSLKLCTSAKLLAGSPNYMELFGINMDIRSWILAIWHAIFDIVSYSKNMEFSIISIPTQSFTV